MRALHTQTNYDVVVCGGGLAGLAVARQLKLQLPELSVAVIDRMARPLPEGAYKVGEATAEVAANYFGKVLQLERTLMQRHLLKLGLRFFSGDPHGPFQNRPEVGLSLYPPITTYQLDRGRLENDMRQILADMGVELFESTVVEDIVLADDAEPHQVICRRSDVARQYTLLGRWVVDALGRRRFLQSKLDLAAPNGHSAGAAWWRTEPRLDLTDMANNPDGDWRNRTMEDRNMSTTHLMGRGYWIWLIPLSSGMTSVGIVTDESIHPIDTYGKSYAHSLEWLQQHEPALWRLIKERNPVDFHRLKNFSYHARQIFSHHRWSCTGEAGIFLDPLYSIGSDFIAIENKIIVEMIRRELRGELTEVAVDAFNRLVLDLLAAIGVAFYKDTYRTFGHPHILVAKYWWDTAVYWSVIGQIYMQDTVLRHPSPDLFALLSQFKDLNECVQRLLIDWAEKAPPRAPFAFADLSRMRFLQLLHLDLAARRNAEQYLKVARLNLDRLEELAQVLFWQAVEECLPQYLPKDRQSVPWINAWKMSLDPDRWAADSLHAPSTAPRSLRSMRPTFAGIFAPMTWQDIFQLELLYRLRHVARGKPGYAVLRYFLRRVIQDKPAMWLRRLESV